MPIQLSTLPRLILTLLVCCLAAWVPAGNAHNTRHFNHVNQELANFSITSVAQDTRGYLWVGSDEGLTQLDGNTVRYFTQNELQQFGISNPWVVDLQALPDNRMLIAMPKHLFLYDGVNYELQSLTSPQWFGELALQQVSRIQQISAGQFAVFDAEQILLLDLSNRRYTRLQAPVPDDMTTTGRPRIFTSATADAGNLILFNRNAELYTLDKQSHRLSPLGLTEIMAGKDYGQINALLLDGNQLWLGTSRGLHCIDLATRQLVPHQFQPASSAQVKITALTRLDEQQLAVATSHGLYSYHPQSHLTHYYQETANQHLTTLLQDQQGSVWVGTRTDGIHLYSHPASDSEALNHHRQDWQQLHSGNIWSVHKEGDQLWVGGGNGLQMLDYKLKQRWDVPLQDDAQGQDSNKTIYALAPYGDSILAAGNAGLFQIFPDRQEVIALHHQLGDGQQLTSKWLLDITVASDNQIWLATNRGVYLWQPPSNQLTLMDINGDGSRYFSTQVVVDSRQRTWMATSHGLVLRHPDTGKFIHFMQQESTTTSLNTIMDMLELAPDQLLVAFRNKNVRLLDVSQHLTRPQIIDINQRWELPDRDYMSLSRIGQRVLLASTQGLLAFNLQDQSSELYQRQDGLHNDNFSQATTFVDDNHVYLGTVSGLIKLTPDALMHHPTPPPAQISRIHLHTGDQGRRDLLPDGRRLSLPSTLEMMTVEIATFDYSNPADNRIRYRLLPDLEHFTPLANHKELNLAGLAPGSYTLEVISEHQGRWQALPDSLHFTIATPFYQSPWALALYTLLLCSLIGYWWWQNREKQQASLRHNRVLQRSEERLKLALWGSDSHMWLWDDQQALLFITDLSTLTGRPEPEHFTLPEWLARVHPDDRQRVGNDWQSHRLGNNTSYADEYRIAGRHDWIWLKVTAKKTVHEENEHIINSAGTYLDVTKHKALEAEHNMFSQTFANSNDAVLVLDNRYRVLSINPAVTKLTGYQAKELLNRNIALLFDPQFKSAATGMARKLSQFQQIQGESRVCGRSGVLLPVQYTASYVVDQQDRGNRIFVILQDIRKRLEVEEKLSRLANFDRLTGLANRSLFRKRLEQSISTAEQQQSKLALLFVNLDSFKAVNDTYGTPVGDQLLKKVGRKLLQFTNNSEDRIARIGSDEFVLILPGMTSSQAIERSADSLLDRLSRPFNIDGHQVFTTASLGISVWPEDAGNAEALLHNANAAMTHAKEDGRNNYQYFSRARSEAAFRKLFLEQELRKATDGHQFELHYQPKIRITDDQIAGAEALLRWHHPTEGMISPAEFIPVSEQSGLIIEISQWVLQQAIAQAARWRRSGINIKVAVNVSALHFREAPFVQQLLDYTAACELPPENICIEITEGALMTDTRDPMTAICQLRAHGFEVAIDDFGTGYSSLSYLKRFPVSELKIDKSFIDRLPEDSGDQAIVSSIISLGQNLLLDVTAEGVEDEQQRQLLAELGCDQIQGYLYSKPLTVKAFEQFYRAR